MKVNCQFKEIRAGAVDSGDELSESGASTLKPSHTFNPVTLGDLRRTNRVLEAHCIGCARFVELDPNPLPFDDAQPVPTASKRMVCSACGSHSVMTRPQVGTETVAAHQARVQEKQRRELDRG